MKNRMGVVAMVATAFAAQSAFAQVDLSLADDSRLVRAVTLQDLEALLTVEGHEVSESYLDDSDGFAPIVVATDKDSGLIFGAFGTACSDDVDVPACNGINFMATWTATDANSDDAMINRLNESKAAVSVFKSETSVGTSRYVILDGGQTMENIKVNLQVFLAITAELAPNF
jgi:hypothetical protein